MELALGFAMGVAVTSIAAWWLFKVFLAALYIDPWEDEDQ